MLPYMKQYIWCLLIISLIASLVNADDKVYNVPPNSNLTLRFNRVHSGNLIALSDQIINVYLMLQDECDEYIKHNDFNPDAECLNTTSCEFDFEYDYIGSNDICLVLENQNLDTQADVDVSLNIYYSFVALFLWFWVILFIGLIMLCVCCHCIKSCNQSRAKKNHQRVQQQVYRQLDGCITDEHL
jgi:hypothetical protein